jgi:hypothetical protein
MNSFIYLDEYKMYSISAQIFGGLTESVIEVSSSATNQSEEQKGPVGSGRVLADVMSNESSKEEKRSLRDYAYTMFEKRLAEDGKLVAFADNLPKNFSGAIRSAAVLKVTGKATFTDVEILTKMMSEFNTIGEALAYIINFREFSQLQETLDERLAGVADRNQKAAMRQQVKAMSDVKAVAKRSGLQQDPTFLKHLSYLIRYMMKDAFDVRLTLTTSNDGKVDFTGPLSRDSFREPCDAIIRKYSRLCEAPLTMVGIVTQGNAAKVVAPTQATGGDAVAQPNMKAALLEMIHATAGIEDSFFGRSDNEYVVDPIAVFRQLD